MKEVHPASLFARLKNSSSCLDWLSWLRDAYAREKRTHARTRTHMRARAPPTHRCETEEDARIRWCARGEGGKEDVRARVYG